MSRREKMTPAQAGRLGGEATKRSQGDGYYQRIGRLGGAKGGETTKARYGTKFYEEIGRLGARKRAKGGDD